MSRKTNPTTINTVEPRPRRRPAAWQKELQERKGRIPQLTVVRPVARTALTPGAVVWAHITYEDIDGYKLRPVVVSHVDGRDVTVHPGTTSDRRHVYRRGYRELVDLESAGLRKATGIELAAIRIDLVDVMSVAGALGKDDELAILGAHAAVTVAGLLAVA